MKRPSPRRLLAVVSMLCALGAAAPSPAPRRTTARDFRAIMERLAAGWTEGEARRAADCFTEDALYTEPPDKQIYRGREELFRFFGGTAGRRQKMTMTWHHLFFDEERQIGCGEFTFEFGSKSHGVAVVRIADGRIRNWREYWYESDLDWERFVGENRF